MPDTELAAQVIALINRARPVANAKFLGDDHSNGNGSGLAEIAPGGIVFHTHRIVESYGYEEIEDGTTLITWEELEDAAATIARYQAAWEERKKKSAAENEQWERDMYKRLHAKFEGGKGNAT